MIKPVAIIEMGTPPAVVIDRVGTQSQWFIDALGWKPEEYQIYRPEFNEALPTKEQVSCVVLSGSWSMVTEGITWSETVAEWIRTAIGQQIPMLGVCYGHQLMAYALGGEVKDNPKGAEQGIHHLSVSHSEALNDPFLQGFPGEFPAWLCHYQTVTKAPQGSDVLLKSELDDHQMIRYNPHTYSVQFHPEFSKLTMAACYECEDKLTQELSDVVAASQEPELALSILRRFTEHWG